MKKLTLHRETLRLVSSRAPTRDKVEEGTAANWNTYLECLPKPIISMFDC